MNKIKDLRKINHLTQLQLGKILGVTPRYIAFLENGERTPSLDIAFKIAQCFDTTVEDIFLDNKCTNSTFKKGEKYEQVKSIR